MQRVLYVLMVYGLCNRRTKIEERNERRRLLSLIGQYLGYHAIFPVRGINAGKRCVGAGIGLTTSRFEGLKTEHKQCTSLAC